MRDDLSQSELIDAYLQGGLSKQEKLRFEMEMEQDPLLQNEVKLQHDVVRSLRETRVAELKSRLNAVPLDTAAGIVSMESLKLAAATLVGLGIAVSAYFYYPSPEEQILAHHFSLEEYTPIANNDGIPSKPEAIALKPEKSAEKQQKTTENKGDNSNKISEKAAKNGQKQQEKAVAEVSQPNVITQFEDDNSVSNDIDPALPADDNLFNSRSQAETSLEVANKTDSRYDFHYQYHQNRLFLFGDFEGIPYEILALNTEDSTRLFLKYKEAFYAIHRSEEVQPLAPIEDSALVKELKIVGKYK